MVEGFGSIDEVVTCKLCLEDYKELGADSFLAFALWRCFRRSSTAAQLVDRSTA